MEMKEVSSASADLKSAFRKNPLYFVIASIVSILAVIGALTCGFLGFSFLQTSSAGNEDSAEMPSENSEFSEGEAVQELNAAYGTITTIDGDLLTLEVTLDEAAITFVFELTPDTTYASFTYDGEDDLVGEETSSERGSLSAGDSVTVYTSEEVGSVSPQRAVHVLRIIQ